MTAVRAVVRRGGAWLPLIACTALAGTACDLALPAALGRAVDAVVAHSGTAGWLRLCAGLIALSVGCDLVMTYASAVCVADTTAWLRRRLVRHLLAVGPRTGLDTGDLVSRVTSNAADAALAGPSLLSVATGIVPPIGSVVLLALIDPWLAAAFLAGLALVAVMLRTFTRHTADVLTRYQRVQGRLAARLAESLSGVRTIAAAGTVDREAARVLEPLPELREQGALTWRVLSRASAQAGIIGPLVEVAVLTAGGLALATGRISAGGLFAASRYAAMGAGLGALTSVLGQLARARAGNHRAAEVLALPTVPYGNASLPDGPGTVRFRQVSVRAGDTLLLDGVDLTVPGGAAVAVVGRSGAGKSVLVALAARLREPDAGSVLLDGVPLVRLSHAALRAAVSCAFERPVLVGERIADAVGLGSEPAEVRAAARATHAHDFVSRLPAGYDTPLAEAPMSGGENQRLGLARSWRAGRLLILDDATSSVDMVTEMQISRTLTEDHGRRTRLIVTHRPATAARADLVVWLDSGRVRAIGSHERLWDDPRYRAVFQ
ncbi:ABC transporter ATP-binding protein [Rugosimonospora acidiphila]|uniref:ABC transporter ATP-binding protein n=1 Tax=Rugosimonospora acidiphila TaxID=556531 RepID=A0ABP9SP06_9ACTN